MDRSVADRQLHFVPTLRALAALVLLSSLPALAQDAPPDAVQDVTPPPLEPAVAPVPVDAPRVEPVDHEDHGGRVRWGLSGGLGWSSPYPAFAFGLEGRVGAQLSHVLSAFLAFGGQFGFGAGAGFTGFGATANGTLLAHFVAEAIVELTLFNHLSIGGGPAFGLGGLALGGLGIATTGGNISGVSAAGFKPGFDVRAGWMFASPNPRTHRRRGFNLGVDVLTLFHPNGTVTEVVTDFSGAQTTVEKTRTLVTVTPMLTLGFDMR